MQCPKCKLKLLNLENYISHVKKLHKDESNMCIPCGRKGCNKIFSKFVSWKSHLLRAHTVNYHENYEQKLSGGEIISKDQLHLRSQSKNELRNEIDKTEMDFILYLRAKNIPENIIAMIQSKTKILAKSHWLLCIDSIKDKLKRNSIQSKSFESLEDSVHSATDMFLNFNTKWKQNSYIKQHTDIIIPKKILLDSSFSKTRAPKIDANRKILLKHDKLVYVSILDTLKNLIKNKNIKQLFYEKNDSSRGVYKNYSDGSLYKDSELFKERPNSFQIHLYYDGVNFTDTASANPVKMGQFYFQIGNIHPQHNSKLKHIHLVMSVEQELIEEYSFAEILEPLINDIKKLENGIEINGSLEYGTITAFRGDNLASHQVGGYKEGFTAHRSCRTCMGSLEEIRVMIREDKSLLRTSEQYDKQIKKLESAKTKKEFTELSKDYGLNGSCALDKLKYYSSLYGLPPDIFHDLFHGCIPSTLQQLLKKKLKGPDKVMNVDQFNDKLVNFDYGFTEAKPAKIKPQHLEEGASFHQSGAQMWSLAVITPLILGPYIDYEDEMWKNFILLLEISSLICAHQISFEMLDLLSYDIENYLASFQSIYNLHLSRKQHYLVHYPLYITLYGPLYSYNTLRMEGKHQFFKAAMRKIRNYKNPSVSMTNHYVLNQVYEDLQSEKVELPVVRNIEINNLEFKDTILKMFPSTEKLKNLSYIYANEKKYVPKKCFIMVDYKDTEPIFGFVYDIVQMSDKNFFFVYKNVQTLELNLHFNAYEIIVKPEFKLIATKELLINDIFHAHEVNGKTYIIVKRSIGNLF